MGPSRRPRHPALRPHVDRLWWSAGDVTHDVETILPTGRAQLIVTLLPDRAGATIQGPRSRPAEIDASTQRRAVGVAFRPGGTAPFLGVAATELTDRFVPADELWGRPVATLVDELAASSSPDAVFDRLEAELVRRLRPEHSAAADLRAAETALASGARVDDVAAALGVDRRRLAERFAERFGFGLKRYGRIRRFERALRTLRSGRPGTLATIAADLGFADQPHLSREVRHFAGVTPHQLRGIPSDSPTHLVTTGDSFTTSSVRTPTIGT